MLHEVRKSWINESQTKTIRSNCSWFNLFENLLKSIAIDRTKETLVHIDLQPKEI